MKNIGFVGGGMMAEAIVSGILGMRLVAPEGIIVSDPSAERRKVMSEQYQVRTTTSNRQALVDSEVLVLAVKPQNLAPVFAELQGTLQPNQLVLSIVAGLGVEAMAAGLAHPVVVRVMPDAPAKIGYGISVWYPTSAVSEEGRELVRAILQGLGQEIMVQDEKYIDMATALSGSGPAYVALFIEALIDAGVHVGLPRAIAHELVIQTVLGATLLTEKTGKHPAEIRNMVTSPGGTTAEGLLRLEQGRLRAVLVEAVIAAYQKARQLGDVNRK